MRIEGGYAIIITINFRMFEIELGDERMSDTGFLFALIGITLFIVVVAVIVAVSSVTSAVAGIVDDEDDVEE